MNVKNRTSKIWGYVEIIVYRILTIIFSIFGKELTTEQSLAFMQFIKFGIIGVSNTVLSYLIYLGSLLLFRRYHIFISIDYYMAQFTAFLLSVLWSFYWNNKMVFTLEEGEHRHLWKALLKTYISYSFTGLFLNSLLLFLWVDTLHISEYFAPVINLFISVPLNFMINKFWAFKTE